MTCIECNHARKAFVKGKVCCGMLSMAKHFGKYPDKVKCPYCGEILEDYTKQTDFEAFLDMVEFKEDVIYEGWANLGHRPDSKSSDGLRTNFCYIVDENNMCNYFEVRK